MKTKGKSHKPAKIPAFVRSAERAMRRAARKVRAENRRLGLPVLAWQDGKLVKKAA